MKPDAAENVEPCPLCADTKLVPGLGTECMACREEVELPQAAPYVTPSDAQPAPAPDVPVKRYCLVFDKASGSRLLVEDVNGDWVSFGDYESLLISHDTALASKDAVIAELRRREFRAHNRNAELDRRNELLFYALMNLTDYLKEHDEEGLICHASQMVDAEIAMAQSAPAIDAALEVSASPTADQRGRA